MISTQNSQKLSTEIVDKTKAFICKAIAKNGNKYDYSKTVYFKATIPLTITCPYHGDYTQTPNRHLRGINGCKKCKPYSILDFAKAADETWHGRFNYSLVNYVNNATKVKIICREHGVFMQLPRNHIAGNNGCKKCQSINHHSRNKTYQHKPKITQKSEFVEAAVAAWGNRFNYANTNFKTIKGKVMINCPDHGDFEQVAYSHLQHHLGCKLCRKAKTSLTTKEFIKRAQAIHGETFDYSNSIYKSSRLKIAIRCIRHDMVFLQTPTRHLDGSNGCPCCKRPNSYDFINKCINVWGDRFDYSKTKYLNSTTKVIIICREHGEFEQLPNNHLQNHNGCKKCLKLSA